MTDELSISRPRDGEQKIAAPRGWAEPPNGVVRGVENVSLEAVIAVLIKRGICTETELLTAETELRASNFPPPVMEEAAYFKPVQTYSARDARHRHHNADNNRWRKWAAQYSWSRKIGGFLFGWKWHRKKSE